ANCLYFNSTSFAGRAASVPVPGADSARALVAASGRLEALRRHSRQVAARRARRVQVRPDAPAPAHAAHAAHAGPAPPHASHPPLLQFTERPRDGTRSGDGGGESYPLTFPEWIQIN
ncbi:hypothetical protein ACJJTC_004681, partial [Scirpophaga incertulas]